MTYNTITHRTILESILAGYWEWNIKDWTVYLSPKFKQTFGYQEDEIDENADTIRSIIDPNDMQMFDEAVRKHIEEGGRVPFVTELRYRHKNGSTVWINCTGGVVEWDEQQQPVKLVGCHVNVTHLKEAEQAMLAEKKLLEDYFDLNLDLLAIMQTDGKLMRVNAQWEQSLGYSKTELYQLYFIDLVHPEDLPTVSAFFSQVPQKGETYQAEFTIRYRTKNGSYSTIEWRLLTKQNLIYASARDITLRIEALQERDRLRRMNESIVKATTDGIIMRDKTGAVVFYNRAAAAMLDLPETSSGIVPTGQLNLNTVREDGSSYNPEEYPSMQVLRNATPVFNQVMGFMKKNGQMLWMLVNSVPVMEEDGATVAAAVTSLTDITELKSKENKLQETIQIALAQKERLEQFAHIVSHNLRSHSGNIAALINLLDNASDDKERAELFTYLKKASGQLMQTIADLNEIVDANKSDAIRKLHLKTQVESVIYSLAADIREKSVEMSICVAEDLYIEYKPAYLDSILLNLITNAIKYRHPQRLPQVHICAYRREGNVWLEVQDNGIGIDLQKYGKTLFGMYKTFHGNRDAKGIGLYITRNQIEEMGGTITVESEPNKGTKFIIRLCPDIHAN
ncbi:MAG: PAS domain S-box protein [Cytophagales bacterium]|nr:PAS domain S-box protein [Bernardetiaceae bacterium]MDW8205974.1 PAS domain S-box protein [Cytophagales bacterium]